MHSSNTIAHSLFLPSFLPVIFVSTNVTQLPENIWWLITCRKDSERGYPADKSLDIMPAAAQLRSVSPRPTRKTDRTPLRDLLANLHPIPTNVLMICYIKAYRRGYCRIVGAVYCSNAARISIANGKKKSVSLFNETYSNWGASPSVRR